MSTAPASTSRLLPPDRMRLALALGIAAVLVLAGSLMVQTGLAARALLAAGLTVALVAILLAARAYIAQRNRQRVHELLTGFIEKDATPSFVTDEDGQIQAGNAAARTQFGDMDGGTLAAALGAVFANPSAVLYRLQCRAKLDGSAREDIVTRQGHLRLAVHLMEDQGFLWRIETIPGRAGGARGGDSLPLAMVTLGRSGAILYMNETARQLIGARVKTLDRMFAKLPVQAGAINTLSTADGPLDVIVAEHGGVGGRREMFFIPADGAGAAERTGLLDSLPVAMIKVARDGVILQTNQQARRLIGTDHHGARLDDVMQGLGRPVADWLRESLAGQATHQSEFLRVNREDREVFIQVTLISVTEAGEERLIAILNDATELKTLEAQFVQSQKMQAIGQLAGGVAHDFNNLLTAISGHCDLLLLRHDQRDQDYGDLVQIHQNANRAAALVSQLLAFSRKQTLRPETLDLRDTLSDLTHLLNRLVGERVTLTLSHEPVLRRIRADKRQLEQVLMNLVVNARDAMPEGGEIRIETQVMNLDTPLKRDRATVPAGEYVVVRVSDQGVGIPRDKVQKVFEPFYTTKRTGEGTGLGLPTAYGIVKQSGGFIFVDSREGEETSFVLYFPVHEGMQDEARPERPPAPVAPPQHGEGVVLLVEDEAPVRAFAARALRLRGYTVLEAESAEDALHMLDEPELSVDVFVTDVVMPGMDGPSWVRKALETRPDVRVVFVSGYAEGAFGDSQPSVPNSVFLPKPFSLNQLTETVHQQLH